MDRNLQEQFLSLLRGGLWPQQLPDAALFDPSTDWTALFRLAREQAVAGVVWDGLSKLSVEKLPPRPLRMEWYAYVVQVEKSNLLLNRSVVDIFEIYQKAGLSPILLKGQGVATLYPNPLHRECGDIDVYIGKESCHRANQLLLEAGATHLVEDKAEHHSSLSWGKITVENHRQMAVLFSKAATRQFEHALAAWHPSTPATVTIEQHAIPVAPETFNAQYIFLHLYKHFFILGVGLRQVCDWILLLEQLPERPKPLDGYREVWQTLELMGVSYLGLSRGATSTYPRRCHHKATILLSRILQEGNFGFNDTELFTKRPKGYLAGKLFSLRRQMQRWKILLGLFPRDTLRYVFCFKPKDSFHLLKREKFSCSAG